MRPVVSPPKIVDKSRVYIRHFTIKAVDGKINRFHHFIANTSYKALVIFLRSTFLGSSVQINALFSHFIGFSRRFSTKKKIN